jgi:anti-anti-sigma factor
LCVEGSREIIGLAMSRFCLEERHPKAGLTVIEVRGELDLAVAEDLRAVLSGVEANRVVVDLEGCEFIDSTGIAVLLLAAREFADEDRALEVSGANGQVLRVLEVSGLAGHDGRLLDMADGRPAEAA